jgi:hypothetical protein
MFEKEKIQEAYVNSILSESSERQVSQAIAKVFPNVKVNKVDVKRKIIFHLSDFVDEEDFDSFSKIDTIQDFIKKKYKGSIVKFKGRTIEVEEL